MDIPVDPAGAGGPPSNDGPASARVTALAAGQDADDVVARQPDDRGATTSAAHAHVNVTRSPTRERWVNIKGCRLRVPGLYVQPVAAAG